MRIIQLFFPLLLATCSLDTQLLKGSWQAVGFYEKGQSLAASLDSVVLTFSRDDQYEFRSIGYYQERGPFRISGKHLFLTDTTEQPVREHILKVLFLSADTLKIEMRKGESEQVLFFKKQS